MRLNVTKQNTIEVENSRKEDVYFVIVDNVFLELKITSTKDLEPVFIVVEDRQYNHGSIMFKPVLV
ncbi:hypothetical protein [Clostridioides difficile]|uniref:hypothetical protein n=1 Tax=Clostridioides difficile TaxID=1496 RepID=UPI001C289447|nr:hypothetical protein [Clostridioides difficile]MBY1817826.1 hypothetical protein [Clostridioides difficile]MDF3817268.1 hypothetical protein [Clostridioides difficile]HBH3595897.1 hypothetical protein [Clostridioides difficile]HBH3607137.1 hypothetical protein [Clostridioides difficile]HBH3644823.1 hypothetical protein [Clostridioides difficile]